jgi:transcription-repair coupling factor (superfamily II helicase)
MAVRRASGRPQVLLVADNRAAEEVVPVLQAFGELTGAVKPEEVVALPTRDVLPFENLSPHPEIQEQRAVALWKMATGAAAIVVAPIGAAALRLRRPEFYSDLARVLRKGEALDIEQLVEHLNTVGYVAADVVEMPGQYALRGGILDVYSPEADRPIRVDFFGDEVESMRKFDPASQRSHAPVDEAALLPLTETPVREDLLAAIHARLSGQRISGSAEVLETTAVEQGASVFPGWEFYAPIAGAESSVVEFVPDAVIWLDEPETTWSNFEEIWERIEGAHERSGVGNLVRPEELYFAPDALKTLVAAQPGGSVEHLGIESGEPALTFATQPTTRFHGAVPAMVEEVQKLTSEGKRVIFAASSTGEVERLADIFTEYNLPFRLGSRAPSAAAGGETYLD